MNTSSSTTIGVVATPFARRIGHVYCVVRLIFNTVSLVDAYILNSVSYYNRFLQVTDWIVAFTVNQLFEYHIVLHEDH